MKRLLATALYLLATVSAFNVQADKCDYLRNNQQAYRDCVNDWYGRSNRGNAPTPWWKSYDPNADEARQESGDNDWQRQQSEHFDRQNAERQEQNRQQAIIDRQQAAIAARRAAGMNEVVALNNKGIEHSAAGRYEEAASHFRKALTLAREHGNNPQNLATLTYSLGKALYHAGQYAEAQTFFRQALAIPERRHESESDEAITYTLGLAMKKNKQYKQAEALFKNLVTLSERNLDLNAPRPGPALDDWSSTMDEYADAIEKQGRYAEAELHRKRVHNLLLQAQPSQDMKYRYALGKLNANLRAQKRNDAGQEEHEEYLAINRMNELLYLKKYDQALSACDDAMRMAEQHQSPGLLTLAQEKKAEALLKLKRAGEAEALLTQALAKAEKSATAKDQVTRLRASLAALRGAAEPERPASTPTSAQRPSEWQTLNEEAIHLYKAGQIAQAIDKGRQALALTEKDNPANHQNTISSRLNLATFLRADKKTDQADALFLQVLDDAGRAKGSEAHRVANTLAEIAENYDRKMRYAEAETLYKRALEILDRQPGATDAQITGILKGLANVYRSSKREDEAIPIEQRAVKLLAGK